MEKMEPELEPKLNNFGSATLVWHILPAELAFRVSYTVDSAIARTAAITAALAMVKFFFAIHLPCLRRIRRWC